MIINYVGVEILETNEMCKFQEIRVEKNYGDGQIFP